jgi:hypothetical protein
MLNVSEVASVEGCLAINHDESAALAPRRPRLLEGHL